MEDNKNKENLNEEIVQEEDKQEVALSDSETPDIVEGEDMPEELQAPEPMEPLVEIETVYDYKTYKNYYMYVTRVKRHSLIIQPILAGIAIVGAILVIIFLDPNSRIFGALLGLLGLWTVYNIFTEEKKIDRAIQNHFNSHPVLKQNFAMNKELIRAKVVIKGEEKTVDYPWAYVTEIAVLKEYIYLFLGNGNPVILDRNNITYGTSFDLDDLIREMSELKPIKKYEGQLFKHFADINYLVKEEETVNTEDKEEVSNIEDKEEAKDSDDKGE